MQQLGTATKAVTHGLAVGNRDRGKLDQARRLHFVGQPPDDVPDSFFNRDLPRIAQRRGDEFDGLSPLVLIALLEMVAFTGKLIAQTCGDVTDPTRFEWRLAAAEACLVSPSTDGANRNRWLWLRIEPPRLQRRPFGLSHAAMAVSPSMA